MIPKFLQNFSLPIYLIIFQVLYVILLALFGSYNLSVSNEEVPGLYAMFMDVHSMMFLGFGFLMAFLKKYGFSSVGYNFLIAAYVIEWAILVKGWIDQGIEHGDGTFTLSIENLLVSDFVAAAILISFGAVIGKATISQLIAMATFEVVFVALNEYIGLHLLHAYDIGESMYVHAFGAYFGLGVAKMLHKKAVHSKQESSVYHSDLFAILGTLILWLYWPSFNSALAAGEGQLRAVVNTFLSIVASCIATFVSSYSLGKGRLNMIHIQNATLAGGVAVGAIADMAINPFAAVIVGSTAGMVSTLGYEFLTELMNEKIRLHDSCGVHNLHGIPGIISGIASIIVAATATREKYGGDRLYIFYPTLIPTFGSEEFNRLNLSSSLIEDVRQGGIGRTASQQAGFQVAALAITLSMAIVSGIAVGLFVTLPIFKQIHEDNKMFTDNKNWILPDNYDEEKKESQIKQEMGNTNPTLQIEAV